MKCKVITLKEWIPKEKEGTYYELKFTTPENICCIDIKYEYMRYCKPENEAKFIQKEVNVIDFALRDAEGDYVGASGSEQSDIHISAWSSTHGYQKTETKAGEWAIIIGAYKIGECGAEITYTLTFTYKERVWLKGDTHIHTVESDGHMTIQEIVHEGKEVGLDYIFITDHNNDMHNVILPYSEGLTVLPGIEWTHYAGHAGLLGVQQPFKSAFCVNTKEEAWNKLEEGRKKGAIIVINHPFCPSCGWQFGLDNNQYDVIELVNGGAEAETNHQCMQWWHEQLCTGRILPVIGGSDFHQHGNGHQIGSPCTCLYALSPSPIDICNAIRCGNGYIVMQIDGPTVWAESEGKILGEIVSKGSQVKICFRNLSRGDTVCLITDYNIETMVCNEESGHAEWYRTYSKAKFIRFEVLHCEQEMLLSNPIYFR